MPTCPVTFDFPAAADAVAECRRHARYLDLLADARGDLEPAATEDWVGRFRDDFDRDFTSTQARLREEASSLRTLAGTIEDAADDARLLKQTCERDHDHTPVGPGPR